MPDSSLRDQIAELLKWACGHFQDDPECAELTAAGLQERIQPQFDAKDAEIERLSGIVRERGEVLAQYQLAVGQHQRIAFDAKQRAERAEAEREWWSRALTRAIAERDRYRLAWESARRGRRSARILARELQRVVKQHSRAREKAEAEREELREENVTLQGQVSDYRKTLKRVSEELWQRAKQAEAERDKTQADLEAYTTDVLSVLAKKNAALEQAVAEREQLRATALDLVAKKDAEIERLWGQIHTGQQQARKVHAALGHDHLGENLSCAMCAALDQPPPEVTG